MRFLGQLFKKKPQNRSQALAMVLLGDTTPPDLGDTVQWLREQRPELPPILDLQTEQSATTAAIPGGTIGFLHVPMPVPPEDLQGPTKVAWHWPEAHDVVPRHQSHVICFASSTTLSLLDLRLLHSNVIAAVAATSSATGVYVGDAMLVREASAYVDEAQAGSLDRLPLLIWIGFNPVKDSGGNSAYTTGLTSFNLLELEVRNTTRAWSDLLPFLADIADYELRAGVQIADGDTVGASDAERIKVRHLPSEFIPDLTVAVIEH